MSDLIPTIKLYSFCFASLDMLRPDDKSLSSILKHE